VLIRDTRAYQVTWGILLVLFFFLLDPVGPTVCLQPDNQVLYQLSDHRHHRSFPVGVKALLCGHRFPDFPQTAEDILPEGKLDDILQAVDYLSRKKIGALIAIEKEMTFPLMPSGGLAV